ncbi:beta-ketoacyl-ACP synthase II [Desulfohalovibrio reitneri]|uniref:beta-ketoacyl-ACP synthase II n=1 Tax=Desulfohalovibrio reitneri TaxID=1307759 RepID=UPI0004A6FD44|nr:beta-ketoacyl-ACP synthase II [Desulfohalovibrio reitneri]
MIGKRVVVTGLSAVTPIGNDHETSWKNLLAGASGARPITRFDTASHATKFATQVAEDYDDTSVIDKKAAKRMDLFTRYAVYCSMRALSDAGLEITEELAPEVACIIGVGLGGLETIETFHTKLVESGPRRVSPFFIPILIANMAAGQASIFSGAKGPQYCTTSACASGAHAIGAAYSDIKLGRAKAAICGGSESTITPLAVAGFNASKTLSTRNDDPGKASRPFDAGRDGFVMGEGAGVMVLEEYEFAKARGANILAEVVGYGASSDAYHLTAPPEDGSGMALSMQGALREAGVAPEDVDHINCHATSTPVGDMCEVRAIRRVFSEHADKLTVTANKSMVGHLLGAAGGVESLFAVLSMINSICPPTVNLDDPDPEFDLNCPREARPQEMRHVLSNSFGFGGTNCSLLFRKFSE